MLIRFAVLFALTFVPCTAVAGKPPTNSVMPPGMVPDGDPTCNADCSKKTMTCLESCMPSKQPAAADKAGKKAAFGCVSKCSGETMPCLAACKTKK